MRTSDGKKRVGTVRGKGRGLLRLHLLHYALMQLQSASLAFASLSWFGESTGETTQG